MTLRLYNSTHILNEYEKHISGSYPRVTDVPRQELTDTLNEEEIGFLEYEEFVDDTGNIGYKLMNDTWDIELKNVKFEDASVFKRGVVAAITCKKGDDFDDIVRMNSIIDRITDKYASVYMDMDKANYL